MTANSAGASLSYNAKNQSTAITYGGSTISSLSYADVDQSERTGSGSTSFASSPLGLGISKTSGSAIYFTRDDKGNLIGERTPDGNRWYYLKDGLGSIVAVISGGGTIGNRYAYDPYGRVLTSTGSVGNPFGYAGGYLDPTGLVKFGARYFDPNLGRWTQQDPISGAISSPGALNRYNYVACDPINAVDASGARSGLACLSAWAGAFFAGSTTGFFAAVLGASYADFAAAAGLATSTFLAAAAGPLVLGALAVGAFIALAFYTC